MNIHSRVAAAAVVCLFASAIPAAAQAGKGVSRSQQSGTVEVRAQTLMVADEAEIRLIREYYVASGLKPKALPPGIAKNLARGKRVPPGLMRSRLPDELYVKLPPRNGYEWAVANNVVLLIDSRGIVHDILRQVF